MITIQRKTGGGFKGDAATQWRAILTNIKSDLEELGTSLEHLIRLTIFVRIPSGWRSAELSQLSPGSDGRIFC